MIILVLLLINMVLSLRKSVLLSNVPELVFKHGEYTSNEGRGKPVPQLVNIGRFIQKNDFPLLVKCLNVGVAYKSGDPIWECSFKGFIFDKTSILCEGFDSKNDPWVLEGSCSLEYSLKQPQELIDNESFSISTFAMLFLLTMFIVYFILDYFRSLSLHYFLTDLAREVSEYTIPLAKQVNNSKPKETSEKTTFANSSRREDNLKSQDHDYVEIQELQSNLTKTERREDGNSRESRSNTVTMINMEIPSWDHNRREASEAKMETEIKKKEVIERYEKERLTNAEFDYILLQKCYENERLKIELEKKQKENDLEYKKTRSEKNREQTGEFKTKKDNEEKELKLENGKLTMTGRREE